MKTKLVDKSWSTKYPELGTGPVSIEPMISEEFYELEKEHIFKKCWINIGHTDRVPNPGDYFVVDIDITDTSILVARGRDGVVRAFHNLCTHRCNRLVRDEVEGREGNKAAFVCGFHCWSFDTTGKLRNLTDESNFHDVDKDDLGLIPITLDEWHGFLFINLDDEPEQTLREYLGGIADKFEGADFEPFKHTCRYDIVENANWKTAMDAQNEVYHLPFQHRNTIGEFMVKKDDRFSRMQDVQLHGKHSVYSTEVPEATGTTGLAQVNFDVDPEEHRLPTTGDFDFHVIFPNLAILVFRGAKTDNIITYNMWPMGVGKTKWEINGYFVPPKNASERLAIELNKVQLRDLLAEDVYAHPYVQSGMASRAQSHLYLQDEEIQIRHFHETVEKTCGVSL